MHYEPAAAVLCLFDNPSLSLHGFARCHVYSSIISHSQLSLSLRIPHFLRAYQRRFSGFVFHRVPKLAMDHVSAPSSILSPALSLTERLCVYNSWGFFFSTYFYDPHNRLLCVHTQTVYGYVRGSPSFVVKS